MVDNGQNVVRRNRLHLKPNLTEQTTQETVDDYVNTPRGEGTDQHRGNTSDAAVVPDTPPRRSQRVGRGTLPPRYRDFDMH